LDKDVSSVEAFARLTWKHTFEDGLHANLAEFPIVPLGKARFRFQVMATHEEDEIQRAAEILANSQYLAKKELQYEKYN
jgi:glycine C-acetyltransferase